MDDIEIDPALIRHEPADDVGENLERVWYAGRRMPNFRYTLDGFTRLEWVEALERARRRHEAGDAPSGKDYLPFA